MENKKISTEQIPNTPQNWEVGDNIYDKIGEITVSQMNDIVSEFGLFPEDGVFSAKEAKALSDFTKDNTDNLETMLLEIGYYPDEVTPAHLARLKCCLMTPRFIGAQRHKDKTGDRSFRRELCEYNEALREMILLHPDTDISDLQETLIASLMWSGDPSASARAETQMIKREIKGARDEVIMHQFATSPMAESAGIILQETSLEKDLQGVDLILDVPAIFRNRPIKMRLEIDVKSNLSDAKTFERNREDTNYRIQNDRVIMWSHITEEFGDRAMLSSENLDKYSQVMIETYQQVCRDLYAHKILWNIQKTAMNA